MFNKYFLKWLELSIMMVLFPVIIVIYNLQSFVIPIIIFASIISYFYLIKKNYNFKLSNLENKKQIKHICIRFLFISSFIVFFLYYFLSEKILIFPYLNFKLWVFVIILYPFLSALPQEVFFRAFFFERYTFLFKNKKFLILINGLFFAITHSIYLNIFVLILAFLGGIIFSINYYYNKSIFLVTVEHALLGNFIFTIGLGHYFEYSIIKHIYNLL